MLTYVYKMRLGLVKHEFTPFYGENCKFTIVYAAIIIESKMWTQSQNQISVI